MDERHILYFMEIKCLRSICGVTGMDTFRNEEGNA